MNGPTALQERLFYELFGAPQRSGPGGDLWTERAWRRINGLPPKPRTLELGCGKGLAALSLARQGAEVIGLDLLPAQIQAFGQNAARQGLSHKAQARVGDMARPGFEARSFDLLWSEGALYNLGLDLALKTWLPLLKQGGWLVFSEVVWFTPEPSTKIKAFWQREYPAMSDEATITRKLDQAGLSRVQSFRLPPAAWWDEYYSPLQAKLNQMRRQWGHLEEAQYLFAATEAELDAYQQGHDQYGYAFFLGRLSA